MRSPLNTVRAVARTNWSDRQFRAGLDLITSSAVNALAGLGFWFVAARSFDEATVGVNAALISTMALVSNLATLGLKNGLIRFIPDYGRRAKQLVIRTYAITIGTTLVLAPIVALIISARIDELDLLHTFEGATVFTISCAIWIVFVLQDSVLVALGETRVIPVANATHAIAKLVLLIAVAFAAWRWGIFFAWVVPVLVVVVAVNMLVMRRFASRTYTTDASDLGRRDLVRFAIGEHASTIVNMGLVGLLPLIVLTRLGEEASAYFAMAWTIAYNLMLANSNVSTAVLAEASQDPTRLSIQAAKGIRQMSLFVIPGTLVLVAVAPYGLRIFGASYASEATSLLQLLAIAAVIDIPVATAIAMLRATRQVARLFVLYLVRTVLIGGLCLALMQRFDLVGVGWGWLLGESIVALLLSATILRPVLIALLPTRIVRMLGLAGSRLNAVRAHHRARPLIARIAGTTTFDVVATSNDTTVITTEQSANTTIVKIGVTEAGATRLQREADVLAELHSIAALGEWRRLLPTVEGQGVTDGHLWWSQSGIEGVPTLTATSGRKSTPAELARVSQLARDSIAVLHHRTADTLDMQRSAPFASIVHAPLAVIAGARPKLHNSLDVIAPRLINEMSARPTTISWVHGDLAPANVLFLPDASSVTGIVDWELGAPALPPEVDLGHFVLALVAESERVEYGRIVATFLRNEDELIPAWARDQLATTPNQWSPETSVIVAWAHHVAANLAKAPHYSTNELWLANNVDVVVEALDAPAAVAATPRTS